MLINGELHYGWFGAFNFDKDAPKDVVFYEFGVKEEDGFTGLAVGHDENHEVRPQLNPSSSEVTLGDLKRIVNGNNEGSEFSLEEAKGLGLKSHGPEGSDFSVDEGEVVTRWISELRGRIGVVNRITSLYGKDKIDELLNHKALYWNKGKARYALSDYRLQLPATALVMRASEKNVPDKVDLVKYKKENGKRISLVEHTSKKVSKKNEVGIIPTNSATAQNAFGATLENNPSLKAQTAGRRSGVNLPDGVKIVNINDIELHFDDGGVMEANWREDESNYCIIDEGVRYLGSMKKQGWCMWARQMGRRNRKSREVLPTEHSFDERNFKSLGSGSRLQG